MGQKVIKLPQDLFDRAEALVARMTDAPELFAASRKSTAAVIRLAMSIGLKELEQKYPATDGE